MFLIFIDAAILMFLLKMINEDDIGFGISFVVALVASIVAGVLGMLLISAMGLAGLLVAGIITAALLSLAIMTLFGVEMKRAGLISGLFIVGHLSAGVLLSLMLGR